MFAFIRLRYILKNRIFQQLIYELCVQFHLSEGTLIYQNLSGLWKMNDFQDSIYHFTVGVDTQLTSHIRLKVEFADDYTSLTPGPEILKNDTAFLTTFLYSF